MRLTRILLKEVRPNHTLFDINIEHCELISVPHSRIPPSTGFQTATCSPSRLAVDRHLRPSRPPFSSTRAHISLQSYARSGKNSSRVGGLRASSEGGHATPLKCRSISTNGCRGRRENWSWSIGRADYSSWWEHRRVLGGFRE